LECAIQREKPGNKRGYAQRDYVLYSHVTTSLEKTSPLVFFGEMSLEGRSSRRRTKDLSQTGEGGFWHLWGGNGGSFYHQRKTYGIIGPEFAWGTISQKKLVY